MRSVTISQLYLGYTARSSARRRAVDRGGVWKLGSGRVCMWMRSLAERHRARAERDGAAVTSVSRETCLEVAPARYALRHRSEPRRGCRAWVRRNIKGTSVRLFPE